MLSHCRIIKHLGSGQFGTVNMGVWSTRTESMEVAVKTLQPNASKKDKVKFLQEAAIMGQFLHPNVVKLYGVVTVGEPVSAWWRIFRHALFMIILQTSRGCICIHTSSSALIAPSHYIYMCFIVLLRL